MRVSQRARPSDYALVPETFCLSFGAPKLRNQKLRDRAYGISALDPVDQKMTIGFLLLVIIAPQVGDERQEMDRAGSCSSPAP
jgi:hypothetical protein